MYWALLQNPDKKNLDTQNPDEKIRMPQNPEASKFGCFKIRNLSGFNPNKIWMKSGQIVNKIRTIMCLIFKKNNSEKPAPGGV